MVGRGTSAGARRQAIRVAALAGAAALAVVSGTAPALADSGPGHHDGRTTTPIKHLVVIYNENVSFDHYFGTYPHAANTDGTAFTAAPKTPQADNLASSGLLKNNPNLYAPKRLSPSQAMTCDQNHGYTAEQYAYNGGKADKFVQYTETDKCSGNLFGEPGLVMDYYDGNTVTAMWNYAQHYAMDDHSFSSTYGPSTPGALNLISGQTHGIISTDPTSSTENPKQTTTPNPAMVHSPNAQGVGTDIGDWDPAFDDCSNKDHTGSSDLAEMTGKNIGDLLNAKGVSWGWFQGGFRPTTPWNGQQGSYAKCDAAHTNVGGSSVTDYSPHHNPFAYYKSTANPHHLAPASVNEIGHNGQANHNYDMSDFNEVVKADKLPAVSFLKAPMYQDGHAAYSDPTDEQHFLVNTINELQKSKQWKDTAVVIAYDDSDGWYDHVFSPVLNGSKDTTKTSSGDTVDNTTCQQGPAALGGYADRCGPGTRQPLLVISPYSKVNTIDHAPTEQASITKFVEDNWRTGRIGDASFDARAGSLNGMFDFEHPNDKQVLLNSNGSVASVKRIPAKDLSAGDDSGAGGMGTDDAATAQLAQTGSSFSVLPVSLGAGAVLATGAAIAVGVRRRRTV